MGLSQQKVAVRGEGGFIGGHLIKQLVPDGVNVIRAVDVKPRSEWRQVHPRVENVIPDLKQLDGPRVNILGVGVSALNMETALRETDSLLQRGAQGYVCVTGVHGIMEAQSDPQFRDILNRSFLTTPDGMPTVWLGRVHGLKKMNRVYGPDYMLGLCELSVPRGYRHFLYGGKPGVAEDLRAELTRRFPGLKIVGTYTPPFRPLNSAEEDDLRWQLETSQADVLWCGLSTPKQERFMAAYCRRLPVNLMVGWGPLSICLAASSTKRRIG